MITQDLCPLAIVSFTILQAGYFFAPPWTSTLIMTKLEDVSQKNFKSLKPMDWRINYFPIKVIAVRQV